MTNKCSIIFVGPPGCGKGTQASFLKDKYDFTVFSAGDELRKEVASGSDLGKEIKSISDSGNLVSDDIINKMAENFVENSPSNRLLFDGFPRKISQAEALEDILFSDNGWKVRVCYFKINDDMILDRILYRFACADCGLGYNEKTARPKVDGVCDRCGSKNFTRRSDDNEESIKGRLNNYRTMTDPIIDYYKKKGILDVIDASLDFDDVSDQVKKVVEFVLDKCC